MPPKLRTEIETEPTFKLDRTKQRLEARDVDMSGSTFTEVNLSGAVLGDVNLAGATISDANLSRLRIRQANLSAAPIVDCRTDGMTIDGIVLADLLSAHRAAKAKGP